MNMATKYLCSALALVAGVQAAGDFYPRSAGVVELNASNFDQQVCQRTSSRDTPNLYLLYAPAESISPAQPSPPIPSFLLFVCLCVSGEARWRALHGRVLRTVSSEKHTNGNP